MSGRSEPNPRGSGRERVEFVTPLVGREDAEEIESKSSTKRCSTPISGCQKGKDNRYWNRVVTCDSRLSHDGRARFRGGNVWLGMGGREETGENELDGNDEESGGEAKTRPMT